MPRWQLSGPNGRIMHYYTLEHYRMSFPSWRYANICDKLLPPLIAEGCGQFKTCTACLDSGSCGWCNNGTGACLVASTFGPTRDPCMPTNWYPITCPTFLSGFPLFYIIGVGCAAGLMIIIVVTMICCRCIGCGVHPADGKSRIYHGRMTPRRQLELTACILMVFRRFFLQMFSCLQMVGAGAAGGAIAYMFISGGTLPDFTTQPIWMSVAISGCAVILIASILYYIGLCVINSRKRQVHCLPSVVFIS